VGTPGIKIPKLRCGDAENQNTQVALWGRRKSKYPVALTVAGMMIRGILNQWNRTCGGGLAIGASFALTGGLENNGIIGSNL
jgi:hypothetical protein